MASTPNPIPTVGEISQPMDPGGSSSESSGFSQSSRKRSGGRGRRSPGGRGGKRYCSSLSSPGISRKEPLSFARLDREPVYPLSDRVIATQTPTRDPGSRGGRSYNDSSTGDRLRGMKGQMAGIQAFSVVDSVGVAVPTGILNDLFFPSRMASAPQPVTLVWKRQMNLTSHVKNRVESESWVTKESEDPSGSKCGDSRCPPDTIIKYAAGREEGGKGRELVYNTYDRPDKRVEVGGEAERNSLPEPGMEKLEPRSVQSQFVDSNTGDSCSKKGRCSGNVDGGGGDVEGEGGGIDSGSTSGRTSSPGSLPDTLSPEICVLETPPKSLLLQYVPQSVEDHLHHAGSISAAIPETQPQQWPFLPPYRSNSILPSPGAAVTALLDEGAQEKLCTQQVATENVSLDGGASDNGDGYSSNRGQDCNRQSEDWHLAEKNCMSQENVQDRGEKEGETLDQGYGPRNQTESCSSRSSSPDQDPEQELQGHCQGGVSNLAREDKGVGVQGCGQSIKGKDESQGIMLVSHPSSSAFEGETNRLHHHHEHDSTESPTLSSTERVEHTSVLCKEKSHAPESLQITVQMSPPRHLMGVKEGPEKSSGDLEQEQQELDSELGPRQGLGRSCFQAEVEGKSQNFPQRLDGRFASSLEDDGEG
ncbi:unnamed protein product, partial [Choristocarpus tenellus]